MILLLERSVTEYYGMNIIKHQNEYREIFGVRVAGKYAHISTS